MARPKTRDSAAKRRWNAPRPSTRPEARPTSQAARDARLRRQIRDGTCHPKRPPAVCDINPVEIARTSAEWAHPLAVYLWAWSADTWEIWHAHVQATYPLEFWGSPRDSLALAVEKFHAARDGWMTFGWAKHERPAPGNGSAAAWWLWHGLDPSIRDVLSRVYNANQARARRAPDPEEQHMRAFLVDAFADVHEVAHERIRYLNAIERTADGVLVVTEPVPPPPLDPLLALRAAAKIFGVPFPNQPVKDIEP